MKVGIRRIDKSLPLPVFQTKGAVAFDFYAREETEIKAGGVGKVPGNVIIEVPEKYMLLIKDRSSTIKKKGLLMTAGVIDQDYCGDEDEIILQFFNPGKGKVTVKKGERLAQGMFVRIDKPEWKEVERVGRENRGGFGTTDS